MTCKRGIQGAIFLALSCAPIFFALGTYSIEARAAIIQQGTYAAISIRDCPGAASTTACRSDGGSLFVDESSSPFGDIVRVENDANNFAEAFLESDSFGTPQARLRAEAGDDKAVQVSAFSFQKYLWTGGPDTLTIEGLFDFTLDFGAWGDSSGSRAEAGIDIVTDLTIFSDDPLRWGWFDPSDPNSFDRLIDQDYYSSTLDSLFESNTLREVSLSTSIDVQTGDTFSISTSAWGIVGNGGTFDSSNSFSTNIVAATTPQDELRLALVPLNTVPTPATIALLGLGLLGMRLRRTA